MQLPLPLFLALVALALGALAVVAVLLRQRAKADKTAQGKIQTVREQAERSVEYANQQARDAVERERSAAKAAMERERQAAHAVITGERDNSRHLFEEIVHLAATRIPALSHHPVRSAGPAGQLLHTRLEGSEAGAACTAVMDAVAAAIRDERIRTDEAAQDVMRTVAGEVRTLAAQLEKRLEAAQRDFEHDPQFTETLYALDHLAVRMRRQVQKVAVVCGDAPGLSRQSSDLSELVVVALSRLENFEAIKPVNHLPFDQPVGVIAPAAEAVAMILAELMENALYCSTGTRLPKVEIHRTATGAAVVISDSGAGLDSVEKQNFARRMLDTDQRLLLTDLGSPPKLGLAAVGRLTRRHPIHVSMEPSTTSGLEAVVHLHGSLLTDLDPDQAVSVAAPLPAGAHLPAPTPEPAPAAAENDVSADGTPGLPQRRRRRALAPNGTGDTPTSSSAAEPEAARDIYASLQSGIQAARGGPTNPTDQEHS